MHWQILPALWLNLEFFYPHLLWLAGLLLKSAVIFGVARLAALCLARHSARARNWLWRVALTVMLLLPCQEARVRSQKIMPAVPLSVESQRTPDVETWQKWRVINSDLERENLIHETAARADSPPWQAVGFDACNPVEFQRTPWRWLEQWALPLWLSVSGALLLAHVLRARAARRWLDRHARAADSQLAASLPLTVSVFLHEQLKSPLMVSGKIPRVYLPVDAGHWSRDGLRAVLLHELAHWQRCDLPWQKIGHLARAVWWWNPFVRHVVAHLNREAELAADDAVLLAQIPAPAYAQTLVGVAARASGLDTLSVGIPFIGQQPLRRRVQTLLSPNRWRGKIGRLALTLIVLSGVCALLTVSVTVMQRRQTFTPEQWQNARRELSERWFLAPAALTAEQQRLATGVLAALKTRLTAQRFLHFKHEVRSRKQDNASGRIIFENAAPGRLELWLDGWRQNYRAEYQPERDARGRTLFISVDSVIISGDQTVYWQQDHQDFSVYSRRELNFDFERMPARDHEIEAARQLQTFLDNIGKNHYANTTHEIGVTEWQGRPAVFFRAATYGDKARPPRTQATFWFDPRRQYALLAHQDFDRADWELLASGTDAAGQPYPRQYRVTTLDRYEKTTTVSEYDVTLFEPLPALPHGLLAKPANVSVSGPHPPSWWKNSLSGWTTAEQWGDGRVPDYPAPAPESLQWPATITPR
jgi:beta-lactamase regulating signal transducer with metallopeptidase domain